MKNLQENYFIYVQEDPDIWAKHFVLTGLTSMKNTCRLATALRYFFPNKYKIIQIGIDVEEDDLNPNEEFCYNVPYSSSTEVSAKYIKSLIQEVQNKGYGNQISINEYDLEDNYIKYSYIE